MLQRAKHPKQPFTLFQRPGGSIWSVRFSAGGKQVRKSLETDNYDEAHRNRPIATACRECPGSFMSRL